MNFNEIYDMFCKQVYNLALNYVYNNEDAEEITQDVFVAVYKHKSKFKGDATIETWIYRITVNKCIDFIRAKKRKKRLKDIISIFTPGFNMESIPTPINHPGILLENKEEIIKIFRIIDELPVNQKTAFLLSKTEQKSNAEIAAIMNLSTKAVESLLHRARTNILKNFTENEG